MMTEKDIQ